MQILRNSISLARLVMVWFALTLGIAVASPFVSPQTMEMICSASGGMKMIVVGDDGQQVTANGQHSLDCPLCLSANAPPPQQTAQLFAQPQPLGRALQPVVSARIAALVGAPLPPRGPPTRA
ncbi:DUF2946 family protein [Acidovorax sp. Be4]|uniref:DUF2946 family protein n=1 Tax=Acidovorax bellezanensis TaxID=2976702 RepID=A0ABT2PMK6_9BURK|nr:DUF2946 family protein [Acidovorax sp. Be4]MCT9811706.1 DUF2946 family protein [Acidovorax sp. Be4]